MKKAKFTAIIGMAVMMSIPVASLAGNEKQVEIVNENIRYCESTYPYNGGILIANFGTEQLNPLNAYRSTYLLFQCTLLPYGQRASYPHPRTVNN